MNQPETRSASARDPRSRAVLLAGPAIRAGLRGRCPNCGQAPLFQGFLKPVAQCQACTYPLGEVATGDGAASFIVQISGFMVGFTALAIELKYHPPMWLHLALWPALAGALALALMRPGKGLMTALQILRTRDPL